MATNLTINYKINNVDKVLMCSEVTRVMEHFRNEHQELGISCLDTIEDSILQELMRSTVVSIVYIEDNETTTFNKYNKFYSINRSYAGEGSTLSMALRLGE